MEKKTVKHFLKSSLSEQELSSIRRAFDIIGDIAVTEIPRGMEKKAKLVARAILSMNTHIKTVVRKKGGHTGVLRLQKFMHLTGEKKKETVAVENGVRLKLSIEKAYYSPRMSSERKRIYPQVKPGEEVLVMFSGIGPYPIEIAKHTEAKSVYAIELNKEAHRFALENNRLNKTSVNFYCGDVKKIMPKLNKKFDRIAMPLPKGAESYLPLALKYIQKGGVIHFYDFLEEKSIPVVATDKVKVACKKSGLKCKIISVVKCGQLAPRAYRVCVDFKVL
ncbi:MAG: class I SAM-dependent methyltransferase family protein [Candidatus Woesearchaeota archaeon]